MGRLSRGRSSSISSDQKANSGTGNTRGTTCANSKATPASLEAACFLFQLALQLHNSEDASDYWASPPPISDSSSSRRIIKTNFLHKLMRNYRIATSLGEYIPPKDDLLLIDSFLKRACYLDGCMANRKHTENVFTPTLTSPQHARQQQRQQLRTNQRQSLLHEALLAQDEESGYSPLHEAFLARNLGAILLFLRHARAHHSLALADLAVPSSMPNAYAHNIVESHSPYDIFDTRTTLIHPMKLLDPSPHNSYSPANHTSVNTASSSVPGIAGKDTLLSKMIHLQDKEGFTPLQLLCRSFVTDFKKCRTSISFHVVTSGDEVEDRKNTSTELNPTRTRRPRSNSQSAILQSRPRSSSFQTFQWDEDGDDGNDINEFARLPTVSDDIIQTPANGSKTLLIRPKSEGEFDYACEVMTFGNADLCALGVPTYSERRAITSERESLSTYATGHVRPMRVEKFALGEMKRNFDSDRKEHASKEEKQISGPATAVAAATYHSLVVTKKGHLYAFGLGKGGRLGTGNENDCPLPKRVLGSLEKRHVMAVAAAENHSLCVTSDGAVFSFGENGFGQLGVPKMQASSNSFEQRSLPRRVEALRNHFIVSVAAGDRHSLALSAKGEVYTWGDNRMGQLGIALQADVGNALGISCLHTPGRVESLWRPNQRRISIAIAASEFSSMVLTRADVSSDGLSTSVLVNTVYEWGHGNHVPTIVVFPSYDESVPKFNLSIKRSHATSMKTNPVGIACAKYHSVAMTDDGRVYTWGLHSEQLGTSTCVVQKPRRLSISKEEDWEESNAKMKGNSFKRVSSSAGNMMIAAPQLVTGMLYENGGGRVVQVAAAENHTCVITDTGHLYTWGCSYGNDVLGHEGVKYQPAPRKVPGVHRAVNLASAKEHTILLLCTSFPPLPRLTGLCIDEVPQLQAITARIIAGQCDLFNVIPILRLAEKFQCKTLISFCNNFVRCNLDGVLSVGRKSDCESYLSDSLPESLPCSSDPDEAIHPLIHSLVRLNVLKVTSSNWIDECSPIVDCLPAATLHKEWRTPICQENVATGRCSLMKVQLFPFECSERARTVAASIDVGSISNLESAKFAFGVLSKETRSIKKRLSQVCDLERLYAESVNESSWTQEQMEKMARRPQLQADLNLLEPMLKTIQLKINLFESCLRGKDQIAVDIGCINTENLKNPYHFGDDHNESTLEQKISAYENSCDKPGSPVEPPDSEVSAQSQKRFCLTCGVYCPDDTSYTLHLSGRRHFNTLRRIQDSDKKESTEKIIAESEKKVVSDAKLGVEQRESIDKNTDCPWKKLNSAPGILPRYNLPSPSTIPTAANVQKGAPSVVSTASPFKKSLHEIIEEEEQKRESFNSARIQKQPGHASQLMSSMATTEDRKRTSLSDMVKQHPQAPMRRTPTWASQPTVSSVQNPQNLHASKKSLYEIQEEEIDFKAKEDKGCVEGKWFIERRERADAIEAIQQEEEQNKLYLELIEEQRRIEQEIEKNRQRQGIKVRENNSTTSKECRGKKSKGENGRGELSQTSTRYSNSRKGSSKFTSKNTSR